MGVSRRLIGGTNDERQNLRGSAAHARAAVILMRLVLNPESPAEQPGEKPASPPGGGTENICTAARVLPLSPLLWQKGICAALNGLPREPFPKRRFFCVAPATSKRGPALMSAGPRKILKFSSAQE